MIIKNSDGQPHVKVESNKRVRFQSKRFLCSVSVCVWRRVGGFIEFTHQSNLTQTSLDMPRLQRNFNQLQVLEAYYIMLQCSLFWSVMP